MTIDNAWLQNLSSEIDFLFGLIGDFTFGFSRGHEFPAREEHPLG